MSPSRALLGFSMALAVAAGCSTEAVFPGLDDATPTPTVLADDHRPASVRADVGQGTVTVDWELVPGAAGYAVYVSSDGALATDAWTTVVATRVEVQAPPAILDATSGPGHWVRVVAVYAEAQSFGMGAVEFAPLGIGWDGLVPSTDSSARWLRNGAGNQDFGYSLAGLGDVNGDTYDDFAVGAPALGTGIGPFVSVFQGSAAGPVSTPVTRTGANSSAFGTSVAGPGSVDMDTLADLVVGAPTGLNLAQTTVMGNAMLFRGVAGATVLEATPIWTAYGPQINSQFGASVTALGDLNGDTRGDLCVGAPRASSPSPQGGLYQCFKAAGDSFDPEFLTGTGSASDEYYGTKVAGVGDLDADGHPDFVATATGGRVMSMAIGAAHLYRGTSTGVLGFAALIPGTGIGAQFGSGLSGAGDVDGDGHDDFVIGSINSGAGTDGTADLYLGRAATPYYEVSNWTPQVVVTAGNAQFGGAIASGDVNADGFSDLMIGAPFHYLGAGSLSLFLGGPAGLPDAPSLVIRGVVPTVQRLGTAVATADVNGDGSRDVIVSSREVTSADPGEVLVYYGTPVRGPVLYAGPSRVGQVGVPLVVTGVTLKPLGVDARMRCTVDWGDDSGIETIDPCTDVVLNTLGHTFAATGELVVRVRAEMLGYGTAAESIFTATVE